MSKRQLTRRQSWRIEKVQGERAARAAKRESKALDDLEGGDLGPEQTGLVIAHFGVQVEVEAIEGENSGQIMRCHLRANLPQLVTGDRVVWRAGNQGTGVIVAQLPRHSELCRPDTRNQLKPVAANVDLIVIVFAPLPHPHANLIDRYLVAAEHAGIQPLLLLNKADLVDEENVATLDRLRAVRPDIALSGDFIVGFPGETDADFAATLDLIREVGYGAAYSFKYSARPGTPAAEKPEIATEIADSRLQTLQTLITEQQRARQEAMVGRVVGVLYEKPGRIAGQMIGKSDHLHAVHVADPEGQLGQLVRARITASSTNSLAAELARA